MWNDFLIQKHPTQQGFPWKHQAECSQLKLHNNFSRTNESCKKNKPLCVCKWKLGLLDFLRHRRCCFYNPRKYLFIVNQMYKFWIIGLVLAMLEGNFRNWWIWNEWNEMAKKKDFEDESKRFYKLSVTFFDQAAKDEKAKTGKFSLNFLCGDEKRKGKVYFLFSLFFSVQLGSWRANLTLKNYVSARHVERAR